MKFLCYHFNNDIYRVDQSFQRIRHTRKLEGEFGFEIQRESCHCFIEKIIIITEDENFRLNCEYGEEPDLENELVTEVLNNLKIVIFTPSIVHELILSNPAHLTEAVER